MIRWTLTLGSIISTVATPVVAQVHHTPTKRTLSSFEKDVLKQRIKNYIDSATGSYGSNNVPIDSILANIPDSYYDRYFPDPNTLTDRELSLVAQDMLKEYNDRVATGTEGQGLLSQEKTLLSLLQKQFSTNSRIESLNELSKELEAQGRFAEAQRITDMMYQYRSQVGRISGLISNYYDHSHSMGDFIQNYYNELYDLDRQFSSGGDLSQFYEALSHIERHINDFNFDGGRIPDLDSIVAASKLAAALHLENMKEYQKIIMWVSGGISLVLSVWIFMLFIRKRKSKMSRGLKTLLLSLSIIMLVVGAAFGTMPFLGGM